MIFALSAGRTGTVFLTRTLPERFPQLVAQHEPDGSRSHLMLANARNLVGRGTRPLATLLERQLARRRDLPAGYTYLEVNPMLCASLDLLPAHDGPLNVIHLTRHPASWVRSIRAFRAAGFKRHLIDYVPFANPYPAPRPKGWITMNRVKRALHRWAYCNSEILALQQRADRYVQIRYEDLFLSRDPQTLHDLLEALDLPTDGDLSGLIDGPVANPGPPGARVEVPTAWIEEICGSLLNPLGYEALEPG